MVVQIGQNLAINGKLCLFWKHSHQHRSRRWGSNISYSKPPWQWGVSCGRMGHSVSEQEVGFIDGSWGWLELLYCSDCHSGQAESTARNCNCFPPEPDIWDRGEWSSKERRQRVIKWLTMSEESVAELQRELKCLDTSFLAIDHYTMTSLHLPWPSQRWTHQQKEARTKPLNSEHHGSIMCPNVTCRACLYSDGVSGHWMAWLHSCHAQPTQIHRHAPDLEVQQWGCSGLILRTHFQAHWRARAWQQMLGTSLEQPHQLTSISG